MPFPWPGRHSIRCLGAGCNPAGVLLKGLFFSEVMMRRLWVLIIGVLVTGGLILPGLVGLWMASSLPEALQELDADVSLAGLDRGWFTTDLHIRLADAGRPTHELTGTVRHGPWGLAILSGAGELRSISDPSGEPTPLASLDLRLRLSGEIAGQAVLAPETGSGHIRLDSSDRMGTWRLRFSDVDIVAAVTGLSGVMTAASGALEEGVVTADLEAATFAGGPLGRAHRLGAEFQVRRRGDDISAKLATRAEHLSIDGRVWSDLDVHLEMSRLHAPTLERLITSLGEPQGAAMMFAALGPLLLYAPEIETATFAGRSPGGGLVQATGAAHFVEPPRPHFISDFRRLRKWLAVDLYARLDERVLLAWARGRVSAAHPGVDDPAVREQMARGIIADLVSDGVLRPAAGEYELELSYRPEQLRLNGQSRSLPSWLTASR